MGRKISNNVVAKFRGFRKEFLSVRYTGRVKEIMKCSFGRTLIENSTGKVKTNEIYANGESDGFRITVCCNRQTDEVLDMFLGGLKSLDWKVNAEMEEELRNLE